MHFLCNYFGQVCYSIDNQIKNRGLSWTVSCQPQFWLQIYPHNPLSNHSENFNEWVDHDPEVLWPGLEKLVEIWLFMLSHSCVGILKKITRFGIYIHWSVRYMWLQGTFQRNISLNQVLCHPNSSGSSSGGATELLPSNGDCGLCQETKDEVIHLKMRMNFLNR